MLVSSIKEIVLECATKFFNIYKLIRCQNPWYVEGIHDNKEWDSNWKHMFPRVLGYKKRGEIEEADTAEFKMYI